jgi:hypothetical protein
VYWSFFLADKIDGVIRCYRKKPGAERKIFLETMEAAK